MSPLKAHLHQSNQRTGLDTREDGRADTGVVKDDVVFPRGIYNTQHTDSRRAGSCQQTRSLLSSRAAGYGKEGRKDGAETLDRGEFSTASSCSGLELSRNLNFPAFPGGNLDEEEPAKANPGSRSQWEMMQSPSAVEAGPCTCTISNYLGS